MAGKKPVRHLLSLVIFVLMASFVCGLFTACKHKTYTADDIYGWWESPHATDHHYVIYIHEEYTEWFLFYDETEQTAAKNSTRGWISGSFDIPEGEFESHEWIMREDYDRTDTGSDWDWTDTGTPKERSYGLSLEFKEGKIYWEHLKGSGNFTIFERSEKEHPMCEEVIEQRQRCYEVSSDAKPLELGEIKYFPENNRDQEVPNAFFTAEITNPNPYRVYYPQLIFYVDHFDRDDRSQIVYVASVSQYIEAESTVVYVGTISEELIDVTQYKCDIRYNVYNFMFEGQKPVVEVGTSEVKKDDSGKVCEVTVKTNGTLGTGSFNGDSIKDYCYLNIIFYKDGEIVGVGSDSFRYLDIKKQNTISWFTPVTDYDYYEIYVT